MRPLFPLLLFALAACSGPAGPQQDEAPPPNIIYIMADDLGIGDIGCYGQQAIRTPNIDRLAVEGLRFTSHYAGTSVCAPSRCVLMTGKHMGHAAIRGNKQWEPHGQMPLPDTAVTVAGLLQEAGYKTGMFGKWGLGIVGSPGAPNRQGWDEFYGYTDQVLAHNYWPEYLVRNEERDYLDNEVRYLDSTAWHKGYGSYSPVKKEYSNDLFTAEALRFIEENRNRPFFLYLPYTIPHDNGEAPEGQRQEVPSYARFDSLDWPEERKGYAAMIERLDGYVGQVTRKVEELGLKENTLIIFTSDNGPMQESRGFTRFFDSNGPYRGGKRDLYEGGIRMPMIASWPGTIGKGRESNHISGFQDFLPTACELAGLTPPPGTDGISYLPTLKGKKQPQHEFLYWEFLEGGKSQAVRKGPWKAVRTHVFEQPDAPWELYNLENDPGEQANVAADNPDIVAELAGYARQSHVPDPNWPLFQYERVE